jgi:hypothetical protein
MYNKFLTNKVAMSRLIYKSILIIFVLFLAIIVTGTLILFFYQDKFINHLVSDINTNSDISFTYSDIKINTYQSFPKFSYAVADFCIEYTKDGKSDTIIYSKNFNINISPFQLLKGKILVNGFSANDGKINWHGYYKNFIETESNNNQSIIVILSNLKFNNFIINRYNNYGKKTLTINAKKINMNIASDKSISYFKFKNAINSFSYGDILIEEPFELNFEIYQQKNLIFNNIELYFKSLQLNGNGRIDNSNEALNRFRFKYSLNSTKDIVFNPNLDFLKNTDGKLRGDLYIKLSATNDNIDSLVINFLSEKISYKYNNQQYNFKNINGYTLFRNNFKEHKTYIKKAEFRYEDIVSYDFKAKLKGSENIAVLINGNSLLSKTFENKGFGIRATGPLSCLLNYNPSTSDITFRKVKGKLYFTEDKNISTEQIISKGNVDIDNNLVISGYLSSNSSMVNFNVIQNDIVNVLNHKADLFPSIKMWGEKIAYNDFSDLIVDNSNSSDSTSINAKLEVNFKSFEYQRLLLKRFKATGVYIDNAIKIDYFTADCFDGNISGKLVQKQNSYSSNIWVNNINIQTLFRHYNNWGQKLITSENISGQFKGLITLSFKTNPNNEIDRNSLQLKSDIQIVNGELKGVNQLEKLSKWIKPEELKVIKFDTLKNQISIRNKKIIFPFMDVKSNALSLSLYGVHTFTNNYEYNLKINFSNILKRKFLNYHSKDNMHSNNGYINLYFKIIGKDSNYNIQWINKKAFKKKIDKPETIEPDTLHIKQHKEKNTSESGTNTKGYKIEWDEFTDTLK